MTFHPIEHIPLFLPPCSTQPFQSGWLVWIIGGGVDTGWVTGGGEGGVDTGWLIGITGGGGDTGWLIGVTGGGEGGCPAGW